MATTGILGLSPGFKFEPEDEEIVELFLFPRLHGNPLPLEGIFIDGDPRSAPPWDLLVLNGRSNANGAFFFAPGDSAKQRKKPRTCVGGGTWVSQKLEKKGELRLCLGSGEEETVVWHKYRFNFHSGSGRTGSTGWVMLEYTIVAPSEYNSFKVCHITFTGHGQKRKRVPDDGYVSSSDHKLATSAPSSIPTCYQEHFLTQPMQARTDQQEPAFPMQQLVDQEQPPPLVDPDSFGFPGFYSAPQAMGHASTPLPFDQESGMPVHMEQFIPEQFWMPLQMDQETSFPVPYAEYGTVPLPVDQESSMPGQFVKYGTTPLSMDQQFSMPEQSIDVEDPAMQAILERLGDSATALDFGEYCWADAGQDCGETGPVV